MAYQPSRDVVEKYASVLVNFALGGGAGIKKGDVVYVRANDHAKRMFLALRNAVLRAGGHVLSGYSPTDEQDMRPLHDFYTLASDEQLAFFPERYMRGMADQIDHLVAILSDTDPHALKDIDPKKIMLAMNALRPYQEWMTDKEVAGRYTWTCALYGTPAMAQEAGMTLEEYWAQIIGACFLYEPDPVAKWREVQAVQDTCKKKLNALCAERLHVEGPDVDLWITVGQKRQWVGGGGRNIPSFEVFISPDWRGTEGWIRFDQPLYAHGNLLKGIELAFERGRVVRYSATEGEAALRQIVSANGADRIGEFSLTDAALSRITRFMATTLYDENTAGVLGEGNTHIALGRSLRMSYDGDGGALGQNDWAALGFNDSPIHVDIISTTRRKVTAFLPGGSQKIIYENGHFTL